MSAIRPVLLTLVLAVVAPSPARSQAGLSGAVSLFLDPSARATGMGGASGAVFWGDGPNYWANPALLGAYQGLRYEYGASQLVPSLSDDVFFRTHRFTLGAFGAAVALGGKPVGSQRLDYGPSYATGEGSPDPIAVFHSYEDIESFGIGAGLAGVIESVGGLLGGGPGSGAISRFGDLSLGWQTKTDYVELVPAGLPGIEEASGSVTVSDYGLLARATPINSVDPPGGRTTALDDLFLPVGGLRVDLAYGWSVQNDGDATIALSAGREGDPVFEVERNAWSVHAALGFSPGARESMGASGGGSWILELITPLVEIGGAWDRTEASSVHYPVPPGRALEPTAYSGGEITVLNMISYRWGRVDDPDGGIDGDARGWGFKLQLGDIGGVSFDGAKRPQAAGLSRVTPHTFSVFLDPLALKRRLDQNRSRSSSTAR